MVSGREGAGSNYTVNTEILYWSQRKHTGRVGFGLRQLTGMPHSVISANSTM